MPETIVVETPRCSVCGATSQFTLDYNRFLRWQNGGLIQNVFPEMSKEDRETLISGTHGPCFEKLYAGSEW